MKTQLPFSISFPHEYTVGCFRGNMAYPQQSEKVLKIPLSFPTTQLCEARFSFYILTKTTYHNRLNGQADTRIQLSSTEPNLRDLQKYKTMAFS